MTQICTAFKKQNYEGAKVLIENTIEVDDEQINAMIDMINKDTLFNERERGDIIKLLKDKLEEELTKITTVRISMSFYQFSENYEYAL